eukprot:scaffold803_cov310-Pinguiococcus_pyrenoidosus.AAC.165
MSLSETRWSKHNGLTRLRAAIRARDCLRENCRRFLWLCSPAKDAWRGPPIRRLPADTDTLPNQCRTWRRCSRKSARRIRIGPGDAPSWVTMDALDNSAQLEQG